MSFRCAKTLCMSIPLHHCLWETRTIHIYKWSCTQTKTQNVTLYCEQSFKSKEKKSWRKRESKTARQCINTTGNGWKLKTSNNAQRTKGRHCCGVLVRRPPEYHYVPRKLQTQVQKKRTLIMISRSHVNIPRGLEMKLSFLFKKPKRQGNCLSKTRETRNALSFVKALRHVVVKTTFPQEKKSRIDYERPTSPSHWFRLP